MSLRPRLAGLSGLLPLPRLARGAVPRLDDTAADAELTLGPLPEGARAVLEAMLEAPSGTGSDEGSAPLPGAAALRAQLPHLLAVDEGEHITFTDWLVLVVDPECTADRAVPHDFTWPVRARFTHQGEEFELTLRVIDGDFGALAMEPADETREESWGARQTIERWPGREEISLRTDSPAR